MKHWWIALLVCWWANLAWAEVRVVYHLSEGVAQASRAMNNIRNHLEADPAVKIVVVAHGAGQDFLLDGATGANGQEAVVVRSGVAEVVQLQSREQFVYLRPCFGFFS